jgi:hypothetical protein
MSIDAAAVLPPGQAHQEDAGLVAVETPTLIQRQEKGSTLWFKQETFGVLFPLVPRYDVAFGRHAL